jgi:NUMOD3 motif
MNDFYTYAYLREDLSPYYVGKGKGDRAFLAERRNKPPCLDRIVLLRENMNEKQAFAHEIEMIKAWGRKDLGTGILRNLTDGGEGVSGIRRSDEYREMMSLKFKNRTMSKEHKLNISLSLKGRTLSDEHKAKMILGNLGKKRCDESKARMSLAQKGRTISEETRARMSLAKRNMSQQTKAKMSLSAIRRTKKI